MDTLWVFEVTTPPMENGSDVTQAKLLVDKLQEQLADLFSHGKLQKGDALSMQIRLRRPRPQP